ncbi:glucose-6-phosphate dehydrogenase [Arthrobacter sp. MSA 4-2]|uniref:glucose-6-phosphate dehydrogenase n=1 Tax=Arthrobacter sp. MSA 4-2 TaxID=2794349 RepID=UPI0018E86396|nr:glucose-6-phosphate dehydrogenase [Arthrobacter sp. MSA 4-2]MBJ2120019.1 glucose-6-phosphate dehydrogenase [Arthrobacter sp. MSA 4-2]
MSARKWQGVGVNTSSLTEPGTVAATADKRVRTLLILGASGDLTGRLLLPGLARLIRTGRAKGLSLVGAGSDPWDDEKWRARIDESFAAAIETSGEQGRRALQEVRDTSTYHHVDVTAGGVLTELVASLEGPVAIYFALPPTVSQLACTAAAPFGLPADTRLVMEKPFGTDRESAHQLNLGLARLVPEHNIHRVDHFLGKATVFNILGMRFANRILEPVWNNLHIDKVEVIFDEDLALENRARYYDRAGALRDMIQSHLLHVMALLALNAPSTLHERDLRDHIGSVLRASSIDVSVPGSSRRARYTAGSIKGREVPDYTAEPGVDSSLGTETLAEVTVSINNDRWAGVPFILRSGKALGVKRKEALITFKPVNHLPDGFTGMDTPTRLRIGFGPDTLQLDLDVNGPGDMFSLDRATLTAELNATDLLPYGEVLDGVLSGDPTLSVRSDIAEDCWRIVEPVLAAWAAGEVPLEEYPAGSQGPTLWETSTLDTPLPGA